MATESKTTITNLPTTQNPSNIPETFHWPRHRNLQWPRTIPGPETYNTKNSYRHIDLSIGPEA